MRDFLNTEIKIKHVIIIIVLIAFMAFVPPSIISFIKTHDKSVWAITYLKDQHKVEIVDYHNYRIKMIVSEEEGLMFIRNIMLQDSSKIKSFKIK